MSSKGKKKSGQKSKVAAVPKAAKAAKPSKKSTKKDFHSQNAHLFKKKPKVFRVGKDLPPKRDLTRFVKWPRYVRLQRQRAILKKRLKVPPALNQFTKAVEGSTAKELFRILKAYRPESPEEKRARLKKEAEDEERKKSNTKKEKKKIVDLPDATKPYVLKFGLNHVTTLVESKKAKLVVIAHDVDPIDLVVWLPALCRQMDVPYCIVKGKSRLGQLVYQKNAAAVALVDVRKEHQAALGNLVSTLRISYNDNVAVRTQWGGQIMGQKFQVKMKKRAEAEAAGL